MNTINNVSNLMAPNFSRNPLTSCFSSLQQAIGCANKFFMEGQNVQIVAKDKNAFLVVSPDIARQMSTKGFRLLYGN
ncbi:hypothetical protein [Larkinella terrae]|uniref:Uncharacterized protein n=1 Tax=Larkinella terrae TaxID=2025311 RepID=A0A7K0EQT9_9BACT|nr:hypothetical protein [Larkinella terrae]MRS64157.1 hypothetical protein [Larkinella terrae]